MGYKFGCCKICFQLELSVTITFDRLGDISLAFPFHDVGFWGSSALLCHPCVWISQMLSQGTAAWLDILRGVCERREGELRICVYPCSLNWYLEDKFEITSDCLVSWATERGASQECSVWFKASHFKSWVSSQSAQEEEVVILCVSPTLWFHEGNNSFCLVNVFCYFEKQSMGVNSLTLLVSFFPLKSYCDLSFLSQLSFWLFFLVCQDTSTLFTLSFFLLQFTADPWQESIPFGILKYL